MSSNLIIDISDDDKSNVFKNDEMMKLVLNRITKKAAGHKPDITTRKGRDEIKTLAASIARTKTFLDDAGKAEKNEAQKVVLAVDEKRRTIKSHLDNLRDTTRKPLTDYEDEQERLDNAVIADLDALAAIKNIPFGATTELVNERIHELGEIRRRNDWRGKDEQADIAIDAAETALKSAQDHIQRELEEKANREEQKRIEAKERKRLQLIAEEETKKQAIEREAMAKKEAEMQAENERLRAEAEKARQEADEKAREIARIGAQRKQEQQEAQRAIEAKERENAAKLAELEVARQDEERIKADQAHEQSVKDEIIDDLSGILFSAGLDEIDEVLELIYHSIENGSIRNVRIV